MGGGHGLASLLRGLKRYVRAANGALEITAVVTVTDDGGSSGRLRSEFDVLPPGDFAHAVKLSSEVLAVNGRIYPSTSANVRLEATLAEGKRVIGETRISRSRQPIDRVMLTPRRARPLKETLDAIAHADLITMGPGSL